MADLGFGGRVLAGEDSEEDEEEEELGFQFGGFGASSRETTPGGTPTVTPPKFSVQAPVASAVTAGEEDESEPDDGDGDENGCAETVGAGTAVEEKENSGPKRASTPELRGTQQPIADAPVEKNADIEWVIDESRNGAAIMAQSVVRKMQPSLDATIRRIAELTDSQQRLLELLSSQNKDVCSNELIESIAIVMNKLPLYVKKVQDMKATMGEISLSVDRMTKRGESLRVDAQSHAIKKENKRESLSQWNKLYAAKSSESTSMMAAISNSMSRPSGDA